MNLLQVWQEAILSAWAQVGPGVAVALVTFLGAVVIFVVALVASHWLRQIIIEILRAVQLERLTSTAGLESFWKKADIKLTTSEIVGEFVRWIVILVGFIASVNVLGLSPVVDVLMQILGYVPRVFAAGLILAAGFVIARFVDHLIRGAMASIDHDAARPVGRLSYWTVLVLSFFAALSQLQVAQVLTDAVFQALSWATALALGLAIGLGTKDLISKILIDWYDKIKK